MGLIGDPGSGKTGACSILVSDPDLDSLFLEKYGALPEIFWLDLEDNLTPVRQFADPKAFDRIHYKTIMEKMKVNAISKQIIPVGSYVKDATLDALNSWKDGDEDFGNLAEWPANRILIVDTLTAFGEGVLRWIRTLNSRYIVTARVGKDFGPAQEVEHEFLDLLMDDRIKCHIIVISHIRYQEAVGEAPIAEIDKETGEATKEERGYMMALGKKNPPTVGRHFNTIVMAKSTASGAGVKRVIRTDSTPMIQLKNPFSKELPKELPLETGLATIFKTFLRSGESKSQPVATKG